MDGTAKSLFNAQVLPPRKGFLQERLGQIVEVLEFGAALLHKWADGIHCMNPA